MAAYEIRTDLADQKGFHFSVLLGISAYVAVAGVGISMLPINMSAAPWLVLIAVLALSHAVNRLNYYPVAVWTYIGGLIATAALTQWLHWPSSTGLFLLLIPIIVADMLVESKSNFVTAIIIAIMWGIGAAQTNLLKGFELAFIPGLVAAILTMGLRTVANSNLGLVQWAIDSEQKNARRAEIYYQQREQLSQAMLDVQHANAELAIMNVKLEEAQNKAERASSAKSVFLSNMSHELRTPLNVVIGYTSSMLNMPEMYNNIPLPKIYRNDIQLIKDSGQYLLGLINDVLDLSKIEAGRLELHSNAIDLAEIFSGTLATSIGLLKDKPIQLVPDYPENLPLAWADPLRVRQIILNLMSNAIKFTDTGSVTLQAQVEGDHIRVSIIDTGIGIPEHALSTIFDRFKQAEHDTDVRYGGTGLGLDISQQLSKMHGGELTVQSVHGQGSSFSFTLPLAVGEQLEQVNKPNAPRTVTIFDDSAMIEADMPTILVIEDDASIRTSLRYELEEKGYIVVDSHYGNQVVDLAAGILPTLIVLDLPENANFDVLDALQANPETAVIPIILCSEQSPAHSSVILHLAKPVTSSDLLAHAEESLLSPSF